LGSWLRSYPSWTAIEDLPQEDDEDKAEEGAGGGGGGGGALILDACRQLVGCGVLTQRK
jgi:hypothetical protein